MKAQLPNDYRPCTQSYVVHLTLNEWVHYDTYLQARENLLYFDNTNRSYYTPTTVKKEVLFMELLNGWKNDRKKTGKLPKGWKSFVVQAR